MRAGLRALARAAASESVAPRSEALLLEAALPVKHCAAVAAAQSASTPTRIGSTVELAVTAACLAAARMVLALENDR